MLITLIVPLPEVAVALPKLPTRRSPAKEPKPAGAIAIPQGPWRLVAAVSVKTRLRKLPLVSNSSI